MRNFCGYKCSFRLNAMHNISPNIENKHSHTFCITLYIEVKETETFIPFYLVENKIENYFEKFENCFLNEQIEFIDILPICENIGAIFFKELSKVINDTHYILQRLEINENPLVTSVIE